MRKLVPPCKLRKVMMYQFLLCHRHFALQRSRRWSAGAMLLASLLLVACDSPPTDSPAEEGQQLLVGSWLREYDQEGAHVRRLLVLEQDGRFSEAARVVAVGGTVTEHLHTGQWLFDGINLKRKYTSADGKPLSRLRLPYATFQIRFNSNRAFTGTDNLRQREVHYRRAEPGAAL